MAQFVHYRKDPAAGGIMINGEVLVSQAQVIAVYDTNSNIHLESPLDIVIEVADGTIDLEDNVPANYVLNAAGNGFDLRWAGKTKAEQIDLEIELMREQRALENKASLKSYVRMIATERIEKLEGSDMWKIEKAKGQDMIYGGNSRTLAIYQAIEDVRKANNDKCDEIDALSGAPAIEAYNPEY